MAQGKRNEPTVEPSEADYWYAAGFVDGEGCITVRESGQTIRARTLGKNWNHSWYASVTVSQAVPNDFVLRWMAERWGGAVRRKPERKPNAREAFEWCIVGQQAYRFLQGVLPMLKVKNAQAVNALRLKDVRMGRGYRRSGDDGGRNYLTAEDIAERQAIRAEATRLNQRGVDQWPV